MTLGGVAAATDASESFGVSAAVGPGGLSEAISTDGEVVAAEVSAPVGLGELCEAISTGGELLVADSVVRVSVAVGLCEPCKANLTGGELVVADSAVAGVGDGATDETFG